MVMAATATATVTITVTGAVNHPPVANADSYAADNNAVLSQGSAGGVLANDTDADARYAVASISSTASVARPVHRYQRQGRGRHAQRRWVVLL